MDSAEYLKYVTERVVTYLEAPPATEADKQEKKMSREPWLSRWFGVLPMGLSMWWTNNAAKRDRFHKRQAEARAKSMN